MLYISEAKTTNAFLHLFQDLASAQQNPSSSEGFFLNGSSFAVIPESIRLNPSSVGGGTRVIGFSFRTCVTGELIKQTGDSLDQMRLILSENGSLVLSLNGGEKSIAVSAGNGLNDGRWHTVREMPPVYVLRRSFRRFPR